MMFPRLTLVVIAIAMVKADEKPRCGQPAIAGLAKYGGRIIGGRDVEPNTVPWQAAFQKASTKQQICSASIVSSIHYVHSFGFATHSSILYTAFFTRYRSTVIGY